MVAGKSFFFSKIEVQSCVRFRCTLLHSYFALHSNSNPLVLNDIKQKIISSNNKAISNLNATEISITSLVTDKQNEWEVSMFIKVIKRWENTLQRKDVGDEDYWLEREGIIVFLENEIKKLRSLMNK